MSDSVIQNASPVKTGIDAQAPRTLVNPNNTPRDLWPYRQFVVWKYNPGRRPGDKPEKVPYSPKLYGKLNPATGQPYSARTGPDYPNGWTDIRTAVRVYREFKDLSGIGFILTGRDSYVCGDLDNCVVNGVYSPLACELLDTTGTYAELSPSGRGIRLIMRCERLPRALKTPEIEFYSSGRFVTLTGNVINSHPVAEFEDLDWLIDPYRPQPQPKPQKGPDLDPQLLFCSPTTATPEEDAALWRRMRKANRLADALYQGDLAQARNDYSRAVVLLLNSLARWTNGDAARMERMIRQTALNGPKFDKSCGPDFTWLQARIIDSIKHEWAFITAKFQGSF